MVSATYFCSRAMTLSAVISITEGADVCHCQLKRWASAMLQIETVFRAGQQAPDILAMLDDDQQ